MRTRERTLLTAAAVGPFGALAAMRLFRHKTRKTSLRCVVVALIVIIVLLLL